VDKGNDLKLIFNALEFAAGKHRNQRRKNVDATPYINHPIDLATLLINEANIEDISIIISAILHDTVEDTETTIDELKSQFGEKISKIVNEVTDDKKLPKTERKRLQIENATNSSYEAKMVKLADKICNLKDMTEQPPADWSIDRKREYFDWAKQVVDQIRGVNQKLETIFDDEYLKKP